MTLQLFRASPPLWRDFVKILTMKLWHTSSFSLERTDFKNVIFENIPWAPSEDAEVAEVAEVKRPWNSKNKFSKSVRSNKKDEVCHSFIVKIFTKSLHRGGVAVTVL